MNDAIFDDLALETACKERFTLKIDVQDVIVRAAPAGVATRATIFKAADKHIYMYVASQSVLVLDDVRKIVRRMQCEAVAFLPPHGETGYFDRIGRAKFKVMFPGKHITGEEDIRYYKNLAVYNPALVRLGAINGEVRAYDVESRMWRKVKDYSYRGA